MSTIDHHGRGATRPRAAASIPQVFYPGSDEDDGAEAKAICELCPVRVSLSRVRAHGSGEGRRVGRHTARERRRLHPPAPQDRLVGDRPINRAPPYILGRWSSTCRRELAELQATVRKLAQERVAPRAREIDEHERVPPGPLRAVRRHRPHRPVRPRGATAGPAPGILGLTLAIEEVAKYSNTAALMLLLTRLPDRPGADRRQRGAEAAATSRPIATGERAPASGSPSRRPAATSMGMRTKAVARRRRLGAHRHQVLDVGRASGRLVLRVRQDRPGRLARSTTASSCFIVERDWPGVSGRPHRRQDGRARRRHRRARCSTTCACPPRTSSARSAGSGSRCSGSTRCARSSRRAASGSPKARSMYAVEYVKERAGVRQARSPTSRASSGRSPSSPPRSRPRACSPTAPAWMADAGKFTKEYVPFLSMAKYYATEVAVKVVGRGAADARRGGLHEGPPDRALLPRRASSSRSSRARRRSSSGLIARGVLDRDLLVGLSAAMNDVVTPILARLVRGERRCPSDELAAGLGDDPRGARHRRADRGLRRRAAGEGRDRRRARRARAHDAATSPTRSTVADRRAHRHLRHRRRPARHRQRLDDGRARRRGRRRAASPSTATGPRRRSAARPTCSRSSASAIDLGPDGCRPLHRRGRHRLLLRAAVPPGDALRRPGAQGARRPHDVQLPRPAGQPGRRPPPGRSASPTRRWPSAMLGALARARRRHGRWCSSGDDGLDELTTTTTSHRARAGRRRDPRRTRSIRSTSGLARADAAAARRRRRRGQRRRRASRCSAGRRGRSATSWC